MMITGKQIRAARVLTDWDADDLAQRIGMSRVSVQNIERGDARPKPETLDKIIRAFSDVGIEFIENEGVRRKPDSVTIYEGPARFDDFYEYLYEHLKSSGGTVCIGNSNPALYLKYLSSFDKHKERMDKLVADNHVHFKILIQENNRNFVSSSYAEYRWIALDRFGPTSFYCFGESLALISFTHTNPPYIILIRSAPLAETYRQAFDLMWKDSTIPPSGKE